MASQRKSVFIPLGVVLAVAMAGILLTARAVSPAPADTLNPEKANPTGPVVTPLTQEVASPTAAHAPSPPAVTPTPTPLPQSTPVSTAPTPGAAPPTRTPALVIGSNLQVPALTPATAVPAQVNASPTAAAPSPTSTRNALSGAGREPILTLGASNTTDRGYLWGPLNVATAGGAEARTLWDTLWTPPECWPDPKYPRRPPRVLSTAECAIYYYKPRILILFVARPFNEHIYYDDLATLIRHIESYEDELGLSRSLKVAMGPVTTLEGRIGAPDVVLALGVRLVDLLDIVDKIVRVTHFNPVTDNVHLISSPYVFGIVNTVVQKAIHGGPGVYTIDESEIPLPGPQP